MPSWHCIVRILNDVVLVSFLSYLLQYMGVQVSHPIYFFSPFLLLLPPIDRRDSDPGLPSRFFSPLLPTVLFALHFYRQKKSSALSSPRRIGRSNCAYPRHNRRSPQLLSLDGRKLDTQTRTLDPYFTVSRGTIVNRTYGTQKNLYIPLCLLLRGTIVNRTKYC